MKVGTRRPTRRVGTGLSAEDNDPRAQFLDDVSHELRMPLTALKGQIQLMQRRLRREPEREDDLLDLAKMLYQVQRLNHQLDIFLAATHIHQHRFTLLLAPCDLVQLLRRLVALYAGGMTQHSIQLQTDVDELVGEWDQHRVEEAVEALLSNALKYSDGGEIRVSLSQRQGVAHVEVQDEGIGVPAKERSSIFKAYITGTRAESVGVGLGLYVARETVRRQHGRIGVRSLRHRPGSTFWFNLPLVQPLPRRRRSEKDVPASSEPNEDVAVPAIVELSAPFLLLV
jgi:two-component system, chemotaxis family, CheB/CheR fusion protein